MLEVLKTLAISNAKPKEKPYKLSDGGGLYLLVNGSGKYWRYDYRYQGKRKTLSIGVFPTISLNDARALHKKAKRELEFNGLDPANLFSKKAKRQLNKAARDSTGGVGGVTLGGLIGIGALAQ